MKRFCISISFILLFLFAGDRILGQFLAHMCGKCRTVTRSSHNMAKLNYVTSEVSEDIVCMGASICEYNYVSSIIADSLNCSVYNAGWCGTKIPAHLYILHQMLAVHRPKVICLDIRYNDYLAEGEMFRRIMNYAPCFGRMPQADRIFRDSGDYAALSLSKVYRYNNYTAAWLYACMNKDPGVPDPDMGHVSLEPGRRQLSLTASVQHSIPPEDPQRIRYQEQFIELCLESGIKLFLCIAPKYSLDDPALYEVPAALAERYGVPLLDYHEHQLFLEHPEYFWDSLHMCGEGAKVFTSILAHDLKACMEDESL